MSSDWVRIVGGRMPNGVREAAEVMISGSTITGLGGPSPTPARPARGSVIDADGLLVAPGFIDLQVNGGYGFDLVSDPPAMWELGRQLPRHGVTSFLPTIISSPAANRRAAIEAVNRRPEGHQGAEPLGLHFEGPMLHPSRRGAHDERYLVESGQPVIDGWSRRAGVAMVTLAPELPGAIEVIRSLRARGVVVAGGHSTATATEAAAAAAAGMTVVTHLFNAMEPLHHRRPNLVGFALGCDELTAGLIVDGIHVDPLVVAAAWKAKGPTGLVLVTDAVAAMGLPAGTHGLGPRRVTAGTDGVRYDDGTLAGSNLSLDAAVRNLMAYTGCESHRALATVTSTPAAVMGLADRGRLAVGARADLVVLQPDLSVLITICGGRVVHLGQGAEDRISR